MEDIVAAELVYARALDGGRGYARSLAKEDVPLT